ncbi:MAG: SDR family NAD(P)-dependent oxidoreductase [Alloalcanivorax venustensis]|jgi:NAD(P)-dependent dehydrogenase (short-subunit alcohol dehydrogenase family)|uniref:SDR family NAD(P)-dependent oxidoreductase n=2 Tax=Alloalcanivorax venustensis TaxID=172371 RepID=UPI000EC44904|nr:SDR family NAD(P)-dependent oxidoreductase [Alcanivorax sp.]MCH2551751.1 SDR family NAD(P)-dependent oxidoreductase [Alcanivorax sp.]MEC8878854.1 SDR family NAD(P)-dependent oxidoreductase [Pseudomonadota bacterium]MEE3009478.1 SDR family NAD(P)-dependent oxidoreductase [Pseudomonadota bacterium]HCM66780.1 NAD-dependent epimerase [Alcanivorax sp.]|tara:strand:- start:56 stop:952 length:897 start_codon:yes stop_codon:yes gene_type:complete
MNDIEWQRPDLRPHIKRISAAAGWRWRQRFSPRGALRRRVAGQVVLITGASSGIGAGLSHRLARAGATVLLVARSLEKLQDTVDDIQADGGRAHAYRCDLADLDSCDRLCEQVLAEHGGVDILVNNAGRSIRRSVMHSLDRFHDYQRTMQLNYFGAIRLAMNLIPAMQARGQGHVINVSTMGVQSAPARFSAYLGSKSALEGWTLAAQNELVHTGVEFTLMNYPLVRTPMIAPTAIYRYVPAMSEERAVDWLCEAIVTRPKRKVPAFGLASQVMYQVLPKTSELIVNTSFQLLRDKRR